MMNEQLVTKEMFNLDYARAITAEQLAKVMDFHPWDDAKIEAGKKVRAAIGEALRVIIETVPPSPDRTVAIRKLREARMDCNSAITHNGEY